MLLRSLDILFLLVQLGIRWLLLLLFKKGNHAFCKLYVLLGIMWLDNLVWVEAYAYVGKL